jgi:Flp pilus assembly protein TadG
MLLVLVFGLIDFGRLIYERQVLTNLSREGSNLASRGTTLTNTLAAVIASANPLDLNAKGYVIVTEVFNRSGVMIITNQIAQGGVSAPSKIGTGKGSAANVPVTSPQIPPAGQRLYVTEVFYSYRPITPVGQLMGFAFPSRLYDVSYF